MNAIRSTMNHGPWGADAEFDVPLKKWTSVRVGGNAEVFLRPKSVNVLVDALNTCSREGVSLTILGGGANTLVSDTGVPGLTLKLPSDLFPEEVNGELFTLGAGAPIARLVMLMKNHRRVGAEFLAGIPGTLGGAVAMNAGTKNGECMRVVDAIELATPAGLGWVSVENVPFSYRHTSIPVNSVVTRVRFRLPEGDLAVSREKMETDLAYRKRTQPLDQPNFGSVFTNPKDHHAGRLIEDVGLKGFTLGGAQISTLHANWIVNLGGATASDVVALMETAERRVFDAMGIRLVPEVKRIGVFK